MTLSSKTLLAKYSGTVDIVIAPFKLKNKKRRLSDAMVRETPLSLDGVMLLRKKQDVNSQIAKKDFFALCEFCAGRRIDKLPSVEYSEVKSKGALLEPCAFQRVPLLFLFGFR